MNFLLLWIRMKRYDVFLLLPPPPICVSLNIFFIISCCQLWPGDITLWSFVVVRSYTHTLLSSQAFFSFFKSLQWDKQCSEPREFSACMRCFSSVRFLLWLDNQQHGLDVLLQLIVLSAGLTTFPLQVNPASVNPTCYELHPQLSTALRCNFFREKTLKDTHRTALWCGGCCTLLMQNVKKSNEEQKDINSNDDIECTVITI